MSSVCSPAACAAASTADLSQHSGASEKESRALVRGLGCVSPSPLVGEEGRLCSWVLEAAVDLQIRLLWAALEP